MDPDFLSIKGAVNMSNPSSPSSDAENINEAWYALSKEEIAKLKIVPARFHGNWNYTVTPRTHNS